MQTWKLPCSLLNTLGSRWSDISLNLQDGYTFKSWKWRAYACTHCSFLNSRENAKVYKCISKTCVGTTMQAEERAKSAEVELATVRELQAQTGKPAVWNFLVPSGFFLILPS